MKKYLLLVFLLGCSLATQAQQNVSGIINTYASVTAISASNVISLGATNYGLVHQFVTGDYVVIAQMTGNTDTNAGHYDFAQVTNVSGRNVTVTPLSNNSDLKSRYDVGTQSVQLVWVPYDATGFTVTGTVTPLAYNGSVGGIVALLTPGTITLNANIDASCMGFQVGQPRSLTGTSIYYGGGGASGPGSGGTAWGAGASGGSYGIGGYSSVFLNNTAPAGYNGAYGSFSGGGGGGGAGAGGAGGGGGGGYSQGGGGGGGASPTRGGCGGTGVGTNPYALPAGGVGSVAGVGGTDAVTNGGGGGGLYAGGGGGAYSVLGGGGKAGSVGGAGGVLYGAGAGGSDGSAYKLTPTGYKNFLNTTDPRILMGGGGYTQPGGGIVLVEAKTITSNADSILANGCSATGKGLLGLGGGGAGTILIDADTFSSKLVVSAKGGNGQDGYDSGAHGGGGSGGGGGGAIWISNPVTSSNINTSLSDPVIPNVVFNSQGGQGGKGDISEKSGYYLGDGGCGGAGIVYASPFALVPFCTPPSFTATAIAATCTGNTANSNGTITLAGFATGNWYQYSVGSSFSTGIPAAITAIPANGVITQTLANPATAQVYTVRVYGSADTTCYTDQQVTLNPTSCSVPCTSPNCITTINVQIK